MSASVIDIATILSQHNSHKIKELQKKYEIADESDEEEVELYERTTPLRLIVGKRKKQRLARFPVTFFDTITFYRAFMVTIVKHCNIYIRFEYVNNFSNVMQMLFCSMFEGCLATIYVELFFGIYVPGEHLYISKIAPLFAGVDFLYMMTSMVELTRFSDIVFIYAGFFFEGVLSQNPWNDCPPKINSYFVLYKNKSIPVECIYIESFKYRAKNHSHFHYVREKEFSCYYHDNAKTCLTIPQIVFNFSYFNFLEDNQYLINLCFITIWTIVLIFCNTIFKKQIWRSLTYANLILFTIHVLLLVYLKLILFDKLDPPKRVVSQEKVQLTIWENLINVSNSYVQTPPVLHIIASRGSKENAKPAWVSCILVVTNTLYTMIYFYVHAEINVYAASMIGVDLNPVMNSFHIDPVLHYMFIFFWKFSFGNILSLLYLSITAIHELLILIITYQLIIELLITYYAWLPRSLAVSIVTILGLTLNVALPVKYLVIAYGYLKGLLVLIQLVAVYGLYPINRFIDDLTFYYGKKPARIWRLVLMTYPLFIIRRFVNIQWIFEDKIYFVKMELVYYTMSIIIPIVLVSGVIYMLFKLRWNKMKYSQILCPTMDWGPRSFTIRQLRKQFSYQDYVLSSAPKVLTRYLMRGSDLNKYRVDVCYDGITTKQPPLTVTEAFKIKSQ